MPDEAARLRQALADLLNACHLRETGTMGGACLVKLAMRKAAEVLKDCESLTPIVV